MLNSYPGTKSLLNYKPLSVEKNIKGFLFAKKHQEIFGVLFEGDFDNQIQTIVDTKISKIRNNWFKHEHIHCSVKKQNDLSKNFSLFEAFYYFPFKTPAPFRERVYYFSQVIYLTVKILFFKWRFCKIVILIISRLTNLPWNSKKFFLEILFLKKF